MDPGHWRLVVCGTTHKSSSLTEREALQLGRDEIARANAAFAGQAPVMESAIVSTCNRVEFYFVAGRDVDPADVVCAFYEEFRGLDPGTVRPLLRVKKGKHTADHLFRVAAGVDSMVLGENQILGQVKSAYSSACAVKSAGKVIHRLFHQAFRVGKRVRSETGIGKGACSVSAAAVEMLADDLDTLKSPQVVFVGLNQMVVLAARRLAQIDGARMVFANRTEEKARDFAGGFAGVHTEGVGLDRLPELIAGADIVFTSTSSPQPVITRDMMAEAARRRSGRRLVVVDLAIPRDVDVPKDWDPTVSLRDLEDVERFVADRQHQRELAIPQAEEIIERRLAEFDYWYEHVQHEPIYNGRNRTVDTILEEELAPVKMKLPPQLQSELDRAARRLADRIVKAARRRSGEPPK